MGSFFSWLLIFACVISLVVLFFPFKFRVEFDVDGKGALGRFFLFKKKLWAAEKHWKKDVSKGESDESLDESAIEPEFVSTKPKAQSEPLAAGEKENPVDRSASKDLKEKKEDRISSSKQEKKEAPKPSEQKERAEGVSEERMNKPEKPKLTEEEFWTILLTPEMDARAFRYVKKLLAAFVNIFRVRFKDCFVEGIRSGYAEMGYGAALNGVMKSYPLLKDWDLRMDWCHNQDLHMGGQIWAKLNVCRILCFLLELFFYAAILLFLFWRRRAFVLKTHKLPKLGYVRRKIVGWISEE